jgi:hypothetical protein
MMLPLSYRGREIKLGEPLFVRFLNRKTAAERNKLVEPFGGLGLADDERFAESLRAFAEHVLASEPEPFPGALVNLINLELRGARVEPRLVVDGDQAAHLVLEASTLAVFMVFEIIAAVEVGVKKKRCAHCRKLFLYGPLTGRERHAKYCADRCRVAAMRARNASRGEGA